MAGTDIKAEAGVGPNGEQFFIESAYPASRGGYRVLLGQSGRNDISLGLHPTKKAAREEIKKHIRMLHFKAGAHSHGDPIL